jgi:hypothetical protein
MFVKFNPTLGTATAALRAYNFMRVITSVATASANSTPSVNPLTAAGTYDTNFDLITEVLGNTEAGGWAISEREVGETENTAHNLPDAEYADAGITGRTYRADFWRASGKATYPYIKFTVAPQVQGTWTSAPYMDIIYGIHTDTRYNFVAGYAPSGGSGGGTATTAVNLTAPASGSLTSGGVRPNETGTGQGTALIDHTEWYLASTADYFILIHPGFSITYFGVRELNLWEQQYSDNPPIVGFHTPINIYASAGTLPRKMVAWWRLKDGAGDVRIAPFLSFYQDLAITKDGSNPAGAPFTSGWQRNNVITTHQTVTYSTSEASSVSRISGDPFGGPLFRLKAMKDSYSRIIGNTFIPFFTARPNPQGGPYPNAPHAPTQAFNLVAFNDATGPNYPPIVDPNTGILVPPAYPIFMMISITSNTISEAYFNQGGMLPGLYKSISGSDEFMERYYNPGQNFSIDNEDWYPVTTGSDTLYRDLFLVRRA